MYTKEIFRTADVVCILQQTYWGLEGDENLTLSLTYELTYPQM